jgi:hypothetical protein
MAKINNKLFGVFLCFCITCLMQAQTIKSQQVELNAKEIIKKMHKRYFQGPCKAYAFSQKNTHYKSDTISGHSEWHEVIEFPDKFRIDFGNKNEGNFVIFKNDSAFNYKNDKLIKSRVDSNTLLLLLGGMYYRSLNEVLQRLNHAHYDLNTISKQTWNAQTVYVIGAKENDLSVNQIWIDADKLYVHRIIEKLNEKQIMDMRFEAHQKMCKGFIETTVSFWRNGHLEQKEEYYDIKQVMDFSSH